MNHKANTPKGEQVYAIQSVGYHTGMVTVFSPRFDNRADAERRLKMVQSVRTSNKVSIIEVD